MKCPYCDGQAVFEEKLHRAIGLKNWQVLELWYEMKRQDAKFYYHRALHLDSLIGSRIEKAHLAFRYTLADRSLIIEVHRCPVTRETMWRIDSRAPLRPAELDSLTNLLKQVLRHQTWEETRGPKPELTYAELAKAIRKYSSNGKLHKTKLAVHMGVTVKQVNKAVQQYFGYQRSWNLVLRDVQAESQQQNIPEKTIFQGTPEK